MSAVARTYKNCDRTKPTVYVGRPSALGNPFVMAHEGQRTSVIAQYKEWLADKIRVQDPEVIDALNHIYSLRKRGDVQLICYCNPKPCHGDVIAAAINRAYERREKA